MSLQTIINSSDGLTINRRKMVGIQFTRNETSRVSLTPTMNPWRFSVSLPTQLKYGDSRTLLESIDSLDRVYNEEISFGSKPEFSWMFGYQGVMSNAQRAALRVSSFVGNQLVLTGLPTLGATRIMFEPNDLIQIGTYPYPFTSTTRVLRGTGSTVTLTTHRPNILTQNISNSEVTIGSDCKFNMFCPNMPTYRLFPGGTTYVNGVMTGNARIEWNSEFELYEYLADI